MGETVTPACRREGLGGVAAGGSPLRGNLYDDISSAKRCMRSAMPRATSFRIASAGC